MLLLHFIAENMGEFDKDDRHLGIRAVALLSLVFLGWTATIDDDGYPRLGRSDRKRLTSPLIYLSFTAGPAF